MSVDKLIDSTQLDADLTSVANAIRTKSGKNGQLSFPSGFVSEIGNLLTVSNQNEYFDKYNDLVANKISGVVNITGTKICSFLYNNQTKITEAYGPNVTNIQGIYHNGGMVYGSCFYHCTKLEKAYFPLLTRLGDGTFRGNSSLSDLYIPNITNLSDSNGLYGCSLLTTLVFSKLTTTNIGTQVFGSCSNLESIDFTASTLAFNGQKIFNADAKLEVIILRVPSIVSLTYINNFNGTPFASGGTGGTIYIPKTLYDELGTGSSLDYKSATNWSTLDGYGTITWASIEGSQYENYYADGTAISS